jgi:hypothetical protein
LIFLSCRKEYNCTCNCECDKYNPEPKIDYPDFFIAHAGGAIAGIKYTNCIEALDLSYSKGGRLFELDLRETKDGKIVAVHDGINVTEEVFLNTLIEGKYTPLNMEAINIWFQNHPEAILITDKIDDPQRIYDEFLFRDRVIMELFTWGAIDKAIELKIKPLVSNVLFFETPNFEQVFEDKKIEYICMGHYQIAGNENLFRRLKAKGIKSYVWSLEWPINGQPPEQYVWNYEMDLCYGMYANNLDLLESLLNGQPVKREKPFLYNNLHSGEFHKMK